MVGLSRAVRSAMGFAGLQGLLAVLLALFPVFLLPKMSVSNALFTVLACWGLGCLLMPGRDRERWGTYWRSAGGLSLAFLLWPLAVAIQQAVAGQPINIPYLFTRFVLLFVLAWGLTRLGAKRLEWMAWGCAAAACYAAVWIHFATLEMRPDHVGIYNIIPFSNLALLMGALAAISIGWDEPRQYAIHGVKLLAMLAGMYVAYSGQTRGSWLAVPVLVCVVCASYRHGSRKLRVMALSALVVVGVSIAGTSDMVRERVAESVAALAGGKNTLDSSSGGRIQVWHASLRLFAEHPWTGVGREHFRDALREQAKAGLITREAAELAHSHNDILYAMAAYGVPGLIAVLTLYLAPAVFFGRRLRRADPRVACAAAMGLTTAVSFFIFGLTEAMFSISITNAFYVLIMAWLVAFIVCREPAPRGAMSQEAVHS
ncbi:O-antigen ligase family protein [Pigmentiphaga sp. GD03639]|uniref:O-antigen ligase family protein n=1 Tax=unclassified Pigmentiphaga TaxID=2626614 RepID=UPI00118525A5|nr:MULTISPECIES: O-antigen ligase family protein [unclassified Pigmentiphaga]MDH2238584.1 O-antigen ligase family protein [Pigmentiphaga sp. GD03639]